MASQQSLLLRHRAAVIAVTTTAAALAIIALSSTQHYQQQTQEPRPLRRSNALRRSHRVDIDIQSHEPSADHPLGYITISSTTGVRDEVDIATDFVPNVETLTTEYHLPSERANQQYEPLVATVVRSILVAASREDITTLLPNIGQFLWLHQLNSDLQHHTSEETAARGAQGIADFLYIDDVAMVHRALLAGQRSEDEAPVDPTTASADELKGVLYYIAEEQAKRKAYQHRGIRCEECGESPIRNIRWHCLNCADFDLCSTCKALTAHQKDHIFAEIKIPVPVLAQPIGFLPSWYPGNSIAIHNKLSAVDRRRLAQVYEYDEPEIDALADQFCCLANIASEGLLQAAMDREAFTKALSHESRRNRWQSNSVLDRMFLFYDTESEDKIDFVHFVSGVAYLRGKQRFASLRRAIKGFDLDNSGYVTRDHFVRLLRAKFDAHRLLIEEIADFEEAEHTKQIQPLLQQSQPIGTVFQGEIPEGQVRDESGKIIDSHGDLVPEHGTSILLEDIFLQDSGSSEAIMGDGANWSSDEAPIDATHTVHISQEQQRQLARLSTLVEQDQRHRRTDEALLWDIIDDSIHETLDVLFKAVEARMARILATKAERATWRDDIQRVVRERKQFAKHLESGSDLDPLLATANQHHRAATTLDRVPEDEVVSIQQSLRANMVPTDPASLNNMEADLEAQPLQTLLESSGYAVLSDDEVVAASSIPVAPDPTMPQNRPNAAANISIASTPQLPSRERLEMLADIDADESEVHIRGDRAYLSLDAIEAIARNDQSKEVEGLIKSWLSWAAF